MRRGVEGHCGIPTMPAEYSRHLLKEDFCKVSAKAKNPPLEYVIPAVQHLFLVSENKIEPFPVCLCPSQGKD